MEQHSTGGTICAGIDVSKAWLDIALTPGQEAWREANTAEGHARLAQKLKAVGVEKVGLEATGGYELAVTEALRAEGLPVIVFQPRQVKAYGAFKLQRAKSDGIDARLIAQCTQAQDTLRDAPSPDLLALAEHLTRIEQIEEDLARARIRRERFRDERLLAQLADEIARLKRLKAAELARLGQAVADRAELAHRMKLLLSIPGLGNRTALALVIRMPELGRLSRTQAAALVGVAPFVHESGRYKGQRRTGGGRARLRTSLFAAAQAAALRWNPALVALYRRLAERGRPHALAIVACVRKLVIFANAVIAKDRPWKTPA
ncbi:IS110 family transposase [Bosea vaviloviae]|uniref:Uncharacterized protein n=1 Tax=Bosea vaviloviae TaxID=1526658 RepID=A0A1D7U0V4_9HYPH|nr:IS110 family transposase [Bosea vaviloviae]AOO81007.1 hypothetical protein BHK69_11520 [Bosea vaviloviae]AOO83617.1 hypothetical protein BHK69_27050 [Bosea vaviloviae]